MKSGRSWLGSSLTICLFPLYVTFGQNLTDNGIKLFKEGKYTEAQPLLIQAVAKNAQDAAAHAYLGMTLFDYSQDFDQAQSHLETAVKLDSGNSDYHYFLGACYGRKAEKSNIFRAMSWASKCRSEFERSVALNGCNEDAREALMQYYLQAPGIAGGSMAKAKDQAAALQKCHPFAGWAAFAQIAQYEKNWPRAEECYRQAMAAEPKNGEGPKNLGYFYLHQKRIDEAIGSFKKYVELEPNKDDSHDSLGDGYLNKGQLKEAAAEYQKALVINPHFGASLYNLAVCYEKQGNWQESRKAYERFLQVSPRGKRAENARAKLNELSKKKG